jgi:hypothetical protein
MDIRQIIQPIADQVNQLGVPEVVTHWGHPFFMSIVILAMGSFAAGSLAGRPALPMMLKSKPKTVPIIVKLRP